MDEFNSQFQELKKHDDSFKIFTAPFHTDVDGGAPELQLERIGLQEREDMNVHSGLMITYIGDFYRRYLLEAMFPNLRKFVVKENGLAWFNVVCKQFSRIGFMKFPLRTVRTQGVDLINASDRWLCVTDIWS